MCVLMSTFVTCRLFGQNGLGACCGSMQGKHLLHYNAKRLSICRQVSARVLVTPFYWFNQNRDGKDQGANVRERAKQLVSLLQDEDRLRSEREKSLKNKERFSKSTTGIGSHSSQQIGYSSTANQPGFGGMSSSSTAIRVSMRKTVLLLNCFTLTC